MHGHWNRTVINVLKAKSRMIRPEKILEENLSIFIQCKYSLVCIKWRLMWHVEGRDKKIRTSKQHLSAESGKRTLGKKKLLIWTLFPMKSLYKIFSFFTLIEMSLFRVCSILSWFLIWFQFKLHRSYFSVN